MKDVFSFFRHFMILMTCSCIIFHSNAQSIIAGQTSGDHIYYFDIDDVVLVGEPENPASFHMNIDGGWFDMQFRAYLFYDTFSTSYGTEVIPLENTSISTLDSEENWIEKYNSGDTIDLSMNWFSDPGILKSYYEDDFGHSIINGVFDGEGYMGFKIDSPDLIIGWIRMDVNWYEMTIYDYAFYSDTYVTDFEINTRDINIIVQNPVSDKLLLYLNSGNEYDAYEYRLFNLLGYELAKGVLTIGSNTINFKHIPSGIAVLHVRHGCGFFKSYLIVKQ